jgi:hypothetical protein
MRGIFSCEVQAGFSRRNSEIKYLNIFNAPGTVVKTWEVAVNVADDLQILHTAGPLYSTHSAHCSTCDVPLDKYSKGE